MMKAKLLTLLLLFQMNISLIYGVPIQVLQRETDNLNDQKSPHSKENLLSSCQAILGGNKKYFKKHNNFKRYASYAIVPGGSALFGGEIVLIGAGCSVLMGNPAPLLLSLIPASFFLAGSLVSGIGAKLYFDKKKKEMQSKHQLRLKYFSNSQKQSIDTLLNNIIKTPFADVEEETKTDIKAWLTDPSYNKLKSTSVDIFCRSLTYETNL